MNVAQDLSTATATSSPATSFKVYLPVTNTPAGREEVPRPQEQAPRGAETILLAEDEPALRALTARMLTNHGYTVITAETPEQALEIAADPDQHIDLLLTDLVMPQIDGHKLAQRITTVRPQIRILFMSGYADQAILTDTTLDLEPFLEKPFAANDLARRIRQALDAPQGTPAPPRKREPVPATAS